MCVIINKRNGQKMIEKEMLRKAFNHNSDGAGIAWTLGTVDSPKPIALKKGFMTFNELWDYIEKIKRRYGEDLLDLSMIIHCRITTHGGTSQYNTHPFPISNDTDDLNALSLKGLKTAVAHNGVISSVTVPKTSTLSDTMLFIQKQLYPISELNPKWYEFPKVLEALKDIIGSKLSILNDKGEIYTVGEFHQLDGLEFSNTYFNSTYYSYSYGYNKPYYYDYDVEYKQDIWGDFFNQDDKETLTDEMLACDYLYLSGAEIVKSFYDKKKEKWIPKTMYMVDLEGVKDYYCFDIIDGVVRYKDKQYVEYDTITINDFLAQFKDTFFEVEVEMGAEEKECLC